MTEKLKFNGNNILYNYRNKKLEIANNAWEKCINALHVSKLLNHCVYKSIIYIKLSSLYPVDIFMTNITDATRRDRKSKTIKWYFTSD